MIGIHRYTESPKMNPLRGGEHASGAEPLSRRDRLMISISEIEGKTGISKEYLELISEIAFAEDSVIMIRPYNRHNAPLLAAGHPTKGVDIKGKSSDWGPQFGFIPKDQRFSKLEGGSRHSIDIASAQIDACVESKAADVIDLNISQERIGYLINQGMITKSGAPPSFTLECHRELSKANYIFQAEALSSTPDIFTISHEGLPLRVLAPHIAETSPADIVTAGYSLHPRKAYTADVDLFAVLPSTKNLGAEHFHRRDSRESITSVEKKFPRRVSLGPREPGTSLVAERRKSLTSLSSPEKINKARDITTAHELSITCLLNDKLRPGCDPDFNIIQHGSDQGNPMPDNEANFPVTVICPNTIGEFGLVCVLDTEELKSFAVHVRDAGYLFSLNPRWNVDGLAETSFVARRRDSYERGRLAKASDDSASVFSRVLDYTMFNTNIFAQEPANMEIPATRPRRESNVAPDDSSFGSNRGPTRTYNLGPMRRGSLAPVQTLLAVGEIFGEP